MSIEILERVEMRNVSGFVVLFFPCGHSACAGRPLVDTALYLIKTDTTINIQSTVCGLKPYHRECKGNNFEWYGRKVFMKYNPDVIDVIEPCDVDDFLDNGVSI